tara:strand:+ start:777 stop:1607 length:831 start_codon:yes stop_codon:yes gene_type:complete
MTSNLWYPKEKPIQGISGWGGGATGLRMSSGGATPPFDNYRMFAPMNSIRVYVLVGAGWAQAGNAIYPTKSSKTSNSDFTGQSGTSLGTSTFFDTPTATLASVFGVSSTAKTYVNVIVDDVSGSTSFSSNYSDPNNWNEFPRGTAQGVFISGFWKTDTDDRGSWKVGLSGQHSFPPDSTVADEGNDINGIPDSGSSWTAADAVGSAANTPTSGGLFTAGYNPVSTYGSYADAPYMQFVFNSGLGDSVGFVVGGYGTNSDTRGASQAGVVYRIGIHE